jgi:hypothetical protein
VVETAERAAQLGIKTKAVLNNSKQSRKK